MTEQIDIGGTDSAVPIRNWQLGPASELPDDSAGGEGDYYFTTTTGVGDFYHDGDTWNEVPVGADEANFGSVHTGDLRTDGRLGTFPNSNSRFNQIGRPSTLLDDLNEWTGTNGATIETVDDPDIQGEGVKITASGDSAGLKRSFSDPIDLSDIMFSLAHKSNNQQPRIDLLVTDVAGEKIGFRNSWPSPSGYRLDFGAPLDSSFALIQSKIETIAFEWSEASAGDEMFIGDLREIDKQFRNGAILLEIDNPENDDDDWVLPALEDYGIVAQMGVDGERVESAANVTKSALLDAQDRGCAIVSKPFGNLVDSETPRSDIVENKRWLLSNGFDEDAANLLTWHQNANDEETREIASEYHHMAFAGGTGYHTGRTTRPMSAPRSQVEPQVSNGDLSTTIERCEYYGLFAHVYIHSRNVTESSFRSVLQQIKESDAELITGMDLWEIQRNPVPPRDSITVGSVNQSEDLSSNRSLDTSIYNYSGEPIFVNVTVQHDGVDGDNFRARGSLRGGGDSSSDRVYVFDRRDQTANNGDMITISFVVPAGDIYRIEGTTANMNLISWFEKPISTR